MEPDHYRKIWRNTGRSPTPQQHRNVYPRTFVRGSISLGNTGQSINHVASVCPGGPHRHTSAIYDRFNSSGGVHPRPPPLPPAPRSSKSLADDGGPPPSASRRRSSRTARPVIRTGTTTRTTRSTGNRLPARGTFPSRDPRDGTPRRGTTSRRTPPRGIVTPRTRVRRSPPPRPSNSKSGGNVSGADRERYPGDRTAPPTRTTGNCGSGPGADRLASFVG